MEVWNIVDDFIFLSLKFMNLGHILIFKVLIKTFFLFI